MAKETARSLTDLPTELISKILEFQTARELTQTQRISKATGTIAQEIIQTRLTQETIDLRSLHQEQKRLAEHISLIAEQKIGPENPKTKTLHLPATTDTLEQLTHTELPILSGLIFNGFHTTLPNTENIEHDATTAGMEHIPTCIATHTQLTSIEFRHLPYLLLRFFPSLQNATHITKLSFAHTPGTSSDVLQFLPPNLTHLQVHGKMAAGIYGFQYVGHSAAKNSIQSIEVTDCNALTNSGVSSLTQLPALTQLTIIGCKNVSDTAIEELRKARPNLRLKYTPHTTDKKPHNRDDEPEKGSHSAKLRRTDHSSATSTPQH